MPRRIVRRQNQRGRSGPANRSWTGTVSTTAVSVPVSTKVLLTRVVLSNPGIDETVLRTVGSISVTSDQTAATENQLGAFGLIIVNDVAATLGVTVIPGPVTDIDDDGWFVYVPVVQRLVVATAVGTVNGVRYNFDSRAKRIIHDGTGIAVMIENASAASVLIVTIGFRVLTMVTGS